jgi:hypothetical protein
VLTNVREVYISRIECAWAWDGLKAVPYVRLQPSVRRSPEGSRYMGVKTRYSSVPRRMTMPTLK